MLCPPPSCLLYLEDGTHVVGRGVGDTGIRAGEIVFNTALTGYQEVLTDPSYAGQMVVFTTTHIGNTGINLDDMESASPHAIGAIMRAYPTPASNWRSNLDFNAWMKREGLIGIAEVDTRALVIRLRQSGAQQACLVHMADFSLEAALATAKAEITKSERLDGLDLAKRVTRKTPADWTDALWSDKTHDAAHGQANHRPHKVVVYDFGTKHNILRHLVSAGCTVKVVPAKTPAAEVIKLAPDGVLLSNGPGDPYACNYAITAIRELMAVRIPLFGICLGQQLLALACGAHTVKMATGHHGTNHPVKDIATGRVAITSQNHGFVVDEASLPNDVEITHRSLFDGTIQGIRHRTASAMGFQGHPEASPGPNDMAASTVGDKNADNLFAAFVGMMEANRA